MGKFYEKRGWNSLLVCLLTIPMLTTTYASIETSNLEVRTTTESNQKQTTITGKITEENGSPIIGATVLVQGTTNGDISNTEGKYTLKAQEGAVVVVTYMGYDDVTFTIGTQSVYNIVMKDAYIPLDEVVVIGYGTQKKSDLTGSVANISTDDLNTQSNANITQALQGRIAGVDIVSNGGTPGGGTNIMVRGIGTLNTSTPLYIVDGMYMDGIDHINPMDIASIDILKDASSSAIYGSRAANGVVVVSTKSGAITEQAPTINFSANVGVTTPVKYLDMLDAEGWAEVTTVARAAVGLDPLDMALDLDSKEDNDWQDVILNPALMQNYNLSIQGGGKYNRYYNSVGYYNEDGIVMGTAYERFTIQSKNDFQKGIFSAGINVIGTFNNSNPAYSEARGSMIGIALQSIPTLSMYDEDNVGGYGGTYGDVANIGHPVGVNDTGIFRRETQNYKTYANVYAQLEVIKGLKLKVSATPDFAYYRNRSYTGEYDFGLATNTVNSVSETQTRTSNFLIENLITFDREFGDHKVSALAGYTYQDDSYRYLYGYGESLPDGIYELDATTDNKTSSGYSNRSVLTSVLARAFYSYKGKYLITATLRRDASSKFAEEYRTGYFPSASIGWDISKEDFMQNAKWMNQFKFRGGYGVLGNQEIDDYQYSSTVSTGINYPDGEGGVTQGAFPKTFSSPTIKWEETAMTNIGIDLLLFNNRFSTTIDWYNKITSDILLEVPIPLSSGGVNDPYMNAGKIRNRGFEFSFGWRDQVNSDFSYDISFVGSTVKNEVLNLGVEGETIDSGSLFNQSTTCRTLAGYPIGGFWLISTDGIFQNQAEIDAHSKDGVAIQPSAQPGDIRFVDYNDDGIISDDDRQYQGSPFPTLNLSLNGNVRYKNFDMSIGLQYQTGNMIYNATSQYLEQVTKGSNFLSTTLNYWTTENTDTDMPRLTWDDPNSNSRIDSNRYLEDGTFFKIRNLQIGYTLPQSLFGSSISNARVYANIENLATITGYSGYTPDVNGSSSTSRGFENFIYPATRVFMLGLNLSF